MEKALDYLRMKTAMYITAKEVGIPDPNYFSKCFKKYTGKTQFIVITHRKGTMESADIMYGVTMEESGVSKLLSVKINAKE